MSVKIRLRRMGNKNRPFYRLVVTDSRARRDGKFLETLGYYDPVEDPAKVSINEELVVKWLSQGAEISDTVRSLLKREGILARIRGMASGKSAPAAAKQAPASPATPEAAPAASAEAAPEAPEAPAAEEQPAPAPESDEQEGSQA